MKAKHLYIILLVFFIVINLNAQIMKQIKKVAGKDVKTALWKGKEVQFAAGEIAVKIIPSTKQAEVNTLLENIGGKIINSFDELGWGLIKLPAGENEILAIEDVLKLPYVIAAEPSMVIRAFLEPNDPYFKGTSPAAYEYQWALKNTGQTPPTGTNDADIDAPESWDITTGSSNIILAILDTGIPMLNGSLSHPDLNDPNKIILGPDYVNDGNGVKDEYGHGTHVAGIAAAETNNGTGIAGVAWNCKLMPIQVFDAYGVGLWPNFYNGVKYAVDYQRNNPGIKVVINFSGGGLPSDEAEDAVFYANRFHVPIIASAGNNYGGFVTWPASYSEDYPNVVAVSSTNPNDSYSVFSSRGNPVNVSAPGGYSVIEINDVYYYNASGNLGKNIFSTTPNYPFNIQIDPHSPGDTLSTDVTQTYGYLCGTSMAAPQVTGIAGLLLSVNSNLTAPQIRDILEQSAEDKGPVGWDDRYGYGRVNAYQAVKYTLEHYGGTVSQSFTIPAGETWNFQPGVIVKFASGVILTVNGILNAVGTSSQPITFTAESGTSPESWGTIRLAGSGASGSFIKYANISYATQVDVYNVPDFEISNCNFTDNYKAVYAYNSEELISNNNITSSSIGHVIEMANASTVDCKNNNITKSNHNGFAILYGGGSDGYATENDIYGCDVGIGIIWSSSSSSYSSAYLPKNNRIRNCNDGFKVYRLSSGLFGHPPNGNNDAKNSIFGNTRNASVATWYTTYTANLEAAWNWWGSNPPNMSLFDIGTNGTFTSNVPLSSDPWYGIPKAAPGNVETPLSEESNESVADIDPESTYYGIELRFQKKYKEAKDFFISYLTEHPEDQRAYVELYNCYSKETADDLINFFKNLPSDGSEDHKLLLSYLYLRESRNNSETEREKFISLAENTNNEIIEENPNTSLSVRAKINNIYIALFSENNLQKALSIFTEVADKTQLLTHTELSNVKDAIEIYAGIHKSDNNANPKDIQKDLSSIETPKEYSLLGNYPNPFNPSTTISYNLPFLSEVEITIYDILGNKVKSFVIPFQNSGIQKIIWNGRNSNGEQVSSGIYLYHFKARSLKGNNKVFEKSAKAILLR